MSNNTEDNKMDESPAPSKSVDADKKKRHFRQKRKGNNSAQRREDAFRQKTGQKILQSYRAQQDAKHIGKVASALLLPQGLELAVPTPVTRRLPVTTNGIGLAVSEIYNRFHFSFHNMCTIHQLYRVALAQFEFQLYIAAQDSFTFFPFDFNTTIHFPSQIKDELRGNGNGHFKIIVMIIESVGKIIDPDYLCYVPKTDQIDMRYVQYTNLKQTVQALAAGEIPDFPNNNTLPGAIVQGNRLLNANDFWPVDYTYDDFANDVLAVNQATESMRTKFDEVLARCTFSGIGNHSAFVSTTHIPPVPFTMEDTQLVQQMASVSTNAKKRKAASVDSGQVVASHVVPFRTRPVRSESVDWYAIEPVNPQLFALGILGATGVTSDASQITIPPERLRSEYNTGLRINECWRTVFGRVAPRLTRT